MAGLDRAREFPNCFARATDDPSITATTSSGSAPEILAGDYGGLSDD